jgi:glycerol-3-phosphate acyltransferase PlsY
MSLILCSSWFVLRKITGKSSIASLVITITVPVYVAIWRNDNMWELAAALGLVGLIIIRHLPNLRRLKSHQENA